MSQIGPPPFEYAVKAKDILIKSIPSSKQDIKGIVSTNIQVYINGELKATGFDEFNRWWDTDFIQQNKSDIGYSISSARRSGDAELVFMDFYRPEPNREGSSSYIGSSANFHSGIETRTVLCKFSSDGVIQSIHVSVAKGPWVSSIKSNIRQPSQKE